MMERFGDKVCALGSPAAALEQVFQSCAVLDHWHRQHEQAPVSRFSADEGADIYVVSDAETKARLRAIFETEAKHEKAPK